MSSTFFVLGDLCTYTASAFAAQDCTRASHVGGDKKWGNIQWAFGIWMNIHLRELICTSKMVVDFGECQNDKSVGIQLSTLEFHMRSLIKFRKKKRVVQIEDHRG